MMKLQKRLLSLLLVLCLVAGITPAMAEGEDASFAIGTVHHGFQVMAADRIDYMDTDVLLLEHQKSGAQLLLLENADVEKTFSVAFRTRAINNKGLPHVFEHAALSGSEKYPDPNLLFSMMSQTLCAYLNAETREFVTIYPCASRSEDQLFAYMDVYMSGVLRPLVLTDEREMKREAWHYSLSDPEGEIGLSGVVYSEMLGSMGNINVAAAQAMRSLLYPGSCLANNAGGDPEVIPEMTWQEIKDFHAAYYHPANMLMTLSGHLEDPERFLEQLDREYLDAYDRADFDGSVLDDDGYTGAEGFREQTVSFPVPADQNNEENGTVIQYAMELHSLDADLIPVAEIVCDYLNDFSGPLSTRVSEEMPNAFLNASLVTDTTAPTIVFTANGVAEGDGPKLRALIDQTLSEIAETGIDRSFAIRRINANAYTRATSAEAQQRGVACAENFSVAWAHTGDALGYLTELAVRENLEENLNNGVLDDFVSTAMLTSPNTAMLTAVPVAGLAEQKAEERARKMKELKDAMTAEELDAFIAESNAYDAWLAEAQSVSMIDSVRAVTSETLPEEYPVAEAVDTLRDGHREITSTIASKDLYSYNLYLDMSSLTRDELMTMSVASYLLQNTGTEHYSAEEFASQIAAYTNGLLYTEAFVRYEDQSARLYLQVACGGLSAQIPDTFRLVEESLFHFVYAEPAKLQADIYSLAALLGMYATSMPDMLMGQIVDVVNNPQIAHDYYCTVDPAYVEWMTGLCSLDEEAMSAFRDEMVRVMKKVLNRDGAIVSIVGDEAAIALCREGTDRLLAQMTDEKREDADPAYEPLGPNFVMTMNGDVQYNYLTISLPDAGIPYTGKLNVLGKIITDRILLPELRFVNNAYAAGCSVDDKKITMMSYADPGLVKTYEIFATVPEKLRALELTEEELDGYILAAYSNAVNTDGPFALAQKAVANALIHAENTGLKTIQEIKSTTLEDIHALADVIDRLVTEGHRVSGASPKALESIPEGFFDQIVK